MRLPRKTLERKLLIQNYNLVIGVDEVGMGCLAGPVIACAIAFDKNFFNKKHPELSGVRDSKMLSPKQREELAKALSKIKNIRFAIGNVSPKKIDKINIYQASRLAMRRAIKKLLLTMGIFATAKMPIVLVDGPHIIANLGFEQMAIIKGDQKVFSIACASILAKVFRDNLMVRFAKKHPNYGFEKHKGYGTKLHLTKLAALKPCPLHRKSFAPVGKLL